MLEMVETHIIEIDELDEMMKIDAIYNLLTPELDDVLCLEMVEPEEKVTQTLVDLDAGEQRDEVFLGECIDWQFFERYSIIIVL